MAVNAPVVMAIRLMQMPMLMLTNPSANNKENRRMVSEKIDALIEFQQIAVMWPAYFWMDFGRAALTGQPATIMNRALKSSSQRLAKPYSSRVSSNRRRLSRG